MSGGRGSGDIEGSSPLARGALALCDEAGAGKGIIPACAGSTSSAEISPFSIADHPRLRGEHRVSPAFQ